MSGPFHLPAFALFVDTSCLFSKDDRHVVNDDFAKLFSELLEKSDVQLVVPRVVIEELLSQKMFKCEALLRKAASSLQTIDKLAGINYASLPELEVILSTIRQRFEEWLSSVGGSVAEVPKNVEWGALIDNAVWHRPPFSPRKEDGQGSEKGFKDAIILESLLAFHKDLQDRHLVFVCADALLSQTAKDRLSHDTEFLVVESLEEFRSHLDLIIVQRNKEWSDRVLAKVSSVFFSEEDPNCIWFKFGISDRIHKEYESFFKGIGGIVYEIPRTPSLSSLLSASNPDQGAIGNQLVTLNTQGASIEALTAGTGPNPLPSPLQPISEEQAFLGETIFEAVHDNFLRWLSAISQNQPVVIEIKGFKTSHFKESKTALLDREKLGAKEHVECPQSELANNDIQLGPARLVAATNCQGAGGQSRDGGSVFAAAKTGHFDHRR